MLSGNNGILQRATEAKTKTEREQIIENARIDITEQQIYNQSAKISKEQLAESLNKYLKITEANDISSDDIPDEISTENDLELTSLNEKYKINLSEIFKGNFEVATLGEKYEDSWIGRTISFKSENNVEDWIVLGKQVNNQGKNDVIITTKNPISSQEPGRSEGEFLKIEKTLAEWQNYENTINTACINSVGTTGTLGSKSALIKEVRSITVEDIDNCVGFIEPVNPITISNSNGGYAYPNSDGTGWIKKSNDEYSSYTIPHKSFEYRNTSNMFEKPEYLKYIFANGYYYFVATRLIDVTSSFAFYLPAGVGFHAIGYTFDELCQSDTRGGWDDNNDPDFMFDYGHLRPIVVLSSENPFNEGANIIGEYATYE